MVSLRRHFVPNPVPSSETRFALRSKSPLFLHTRYDADGNMLTRTQISSAQSPQYEAVYTWDYRNRLTEVTYKDNSGNVTETIQYTYDVFNRRISETVTTGGVSTTQYFVYNGQQVVLQLNASGGVAERYLWGPAVDQVLAEEDGPGNVSWPLADNQGTVRDVVTYNPTSGETTLADHVVYDPFGNIISGSNPGIGYGGQYWDAAAGSYYCIARWYNPSTGRYESLDPTGFSAGDPDLYCYVFNDPTNLVDPTGEMIAGGPIVPMLANGWVWPWDPRASWDARDTFGLWTGIRGFGGVGGVQAEGGVLYGAGAQASAGAGYFFKGGGARFKSAGAWAGSPKGGVSAVQNPNPNAPNNPGVVVGASGGAGIGFFVTNQDSVTGILGPFATVNVNLVVVSLQVSSGPGPKGPVWFGSATFGKGIGLSISAYPTTTKPGW